MEKKMETGFISRAQMIDNFNNTALKTEFWRAAVKVSGFRVEGLELKDCQTLDPFSPIFQLSMRCSGRQPIF